MSLASPFASAILPIVTVAAVGYALGAVRSVDPKPLNTVTIYVLVPALIFDSLATTSLSGATVGTIAAGVVAFTLTMGVLAAAVGWALGLSESLLSALVLVGAFSNSGNYGVPLSSFAFGATGRSVAVVYMTVQGVLMYTLGVYVAAGGTDLRAGLQRVFSIPLVYAVAAALVARWADVVPPADSTAMETIGLVGDAAIPLMLLILGIQLADGDITGNLRLVGVGTALKLAVAPAVALGVAIISGFADPTVARTFVVESSTPTAITPLILFIQFRDDPAVTEFVGTAIFVSTLVSVPVLTLLVTVLESTF